MHYIAIVEIDSSPASICEALGAEIDALKIYINNSNNTMYYLIKGFNGLQKWISTGAKPSYMIIVAKTTHRNICDISIMSKEIDLPSIVILNEYSLYDETDIKWLGKQPNIHCIMKYNGHEPTGITFIVRKINELIENKTVYGNVSHSIEKNNDIKTINYADKLEPIDCIWSLKPNEAISTLKRNLYGLYYKNEFPETSKLIKNDDNIKYVLNGIQEILEKNMDDIQQLLLIQKFLFDFGLKIHS